MTVPDPSWAWRLGLHAQDLDANGHDTASAFVLSVQDQGTPLATGATTVNFVGAGVTASGTGATKTVTIAGFSGGLDDLSDVTITSAASGQRLRYNGSLWVNSSLHWEPLVDYTGSVLLDSGGNPQMQEVT